MEALVAFQQVLIELYFPIMKFSNVNLTKMSTAQV